MRPNPSSASMYLLSALFLCAAPAFATVTVTSPASGATLSSPVHYVAAATTSTCAKGVASMGIYVDDKLTYVVDAITMNTTLTLSPGTYSTVVEEWDKCGGASYTPVNITVSSLTPTGVVVTTPTPNSTVSSPVTYQATASTSTCSKGVASMGIYVDNKLIYVTDSATLHTQITLAAGAEHTVVEEWDNCGGAAYTTVNLTVSGTTKTIKSIAVTPSAASFAMDSTEQFTATANYSDGSTANITSTAAWSMGNTSVATITSSGLATGVASGTSSVMAAESGATGSAAASVTLAAGTGVNIPTWHADTNRSGLNASEASLTPSNVAPMSFGKLFSYAVDGYVYGEPLLMSNITVNGAKHNVIYVATEHDSVYAFDADIYGTGAPLWQVSLLQTGETPITVGAIQPYQGVTSTPVIDPSTNTIYVVSEQSLSGNSTFRLNALDITTGAQKFGGPVTIQASVPGTNSDSVGGVVSLTTSCIQRAALLLANGNVYMGFGSCHSGWLLAYDASTLAQTGVFNSSPNLDGEGQFASAGGVWMGGGGPVADSAGYIYITTGNGPWDGKTAFADSILKFNATLTRQDYFTPDDYAFMDCDDADLAAGGLILIPDTTEVVAGGKTGMLYMANTTNLGQESANDAGVTQELYWGTGLISAYSATCTNTVGGTAMINSYEIFGTPAYFNGSLYLGVTPTASSVPAGVRQFSYSGGTLTPGAVTAPSVQENTRGTTPFISADGTTNGILWMIDTGLPLQNTGTSGTTTATLRAYDATNLSNELYNSSTNSADLPGYGIKFTSPVVGNGKVYISTGHDLTTVPNPQGEIDVYGLN
jgi:Bacterial Ig-like domain (group 2)